MRSLLVLVFSIFTSAPAFSEVATIRGYFVNAMDMKGFTFTKSGSNHVLNSGFAYDNHGIRDNRPHDGYVWVFLGFGNRPPFAITCPITKRKFCWTLRPGQEVVVDFVPFSFVELDRNPDHVPNPKNRWLSDTGNMALATELEGIDIRLVDDK